ncbi:class I SAM-dependent methyltransferase [Thiorhodovibrio frisius]|uniref:Methyltransferase family protein n=1 Tax=Thiorhodovibrio frisius TaxID=631362 RepID=H8Z0B5_9GAMM|nr:class I SAM-dependent methyltransferase [Thiorhodovibrio frisius]EIC22323.1 hypothetical protein Thi970DRAFT_02576 [Thiorhodovibrio frisius]WPL24620.1 hypothetical protein Thiofri_04840 [Thiorhodovibrio frisius]
MKEEEIRPAKLFAEYLRLAEQDIDLYFSDEPRFQYCCPACGTDGTPAFRKNGFDYEECRHCATLYVSPRPSTTAFARYYTEAASVRYWATTFYKETAEARRINLWRPKARMMASVLERFASVSCHIIDVGGGYGIFAEEMQPFVAQPVTIVEPGPQLAQICLSKGLPVIEKFLEQVTETDLPQGRRVFVSFELFEHLHDPVHFLVQLKKLMHPGDLFLFTTLSGTGLDIRVLWEQSHAISPPHHLNFFNPHSVQILLANSGFEILDVSTPGKLDLDILFNNQTLVQDRFWQTFLAHTTEQERERCQEILAKTGYSSHMQVICRQP